MSTHSTTEHQAIDAETVDAVLAGRIARGLPAMLAEAYAAGHARASGESFTASTNGMTALLDLIRADYERAERARASDAARRDLETRDQLPFDDTPGAFGDEPDPYLLTDEVPGYLLSMPPVAHGIAPLPPLGGETRSTLGRHIR